MRFWLILFLIILLSACRKESTTWEAEYNLPLLKTELKLEDIIPDSIIDYNDKNEVLIKYSERILEFKVDSLLDLNGDTIERDFTIAPVLEFLFEPGVQFYSSNEDLDFDNLTVELKEGIIENGNLLITAENTIESRLAVELSIPYAKLGGTPLSLTEYIPPATGEENGILNWEIDVSGYELDLTGESGNDVNKLLVIIDMFVPEEDEAVLVTNLDLVNLKITYENIDVRYAKGYLGQESYTFNEGDGFEFIKELNGAMIDLDNAYADFHLHNGFGIDLQANIFQLKSINKTTGNEVSLESEFIGSTVNLSRADYIDESVRPFQKTYSIDGSNSNITSFLEVIPDSILALGSALMNPFGNISNYNDFATNKSELSCDIDLTIPMKLSLSNLLISDTSSYEWGDMAVGLASATLYIHSVNSFPADITLDLIASNSSNKDFINLNDYLINVDSALVPGRIGAQDPESILVYELQSAVVNQLKEMDQIAFTGRFQSTDYPQYVTFKKEDRLIIQLSSNASTRISIE